MDGVAEQKGVIVIGSTNRPEKLDDALLRPGRLDQHIYVPMPSHEDRAAILDSLLSRITSNVDVTRVANVTDGLSPADLVVLIREAKYLLMRGNDPDLAVLEWKHIAAALSGALKGPLTEVFEKSCEVDTDEPEVDEKQAAFWNSFGGNIEGTWGVTAFQQTAAEAAEMHAVLSNRIGHETKGIGAVGAWWRPGGVSDEDLGKYAKFAKGSKK
ncbi:AAA+-type ATPase [Rhizoclosmatium hyalinum]|nr:AAA+-type ATPase [Rhizoclosmatium hyalinum]